LTDLASEVRNDIDVRVEKCFVIVTWPLVAGARLWCFERKGRLDFFFNKKVVDFRKDWDFGLRAKSFA
jgi:hypothetical protein